MKLEVGKKYKTDNPKFAWVEVISQDEHQEQPFFGVSDRDLVFYFTSEGECLDFNDDPIFSLTEEYAV